MDKVPINICSSCTLLNSLLFSCVEFDFSKMLSQWIWLMSKHLIFLPVVPEHIRNFTNISNRILPVCMCNFSGHLLLWWLASGVTGFCLQMEFIILLFVISASYLTIRKIRLHSYTAIHCKWATYSWTCMSVKYAARHKCLDLRDILYRHLWYILRRQLLFSLLQYS